MIEAADVAAQAAVTPPDDDAVGMAQAFRSSQGGWSLVIALGLFVAADQLLTFTLTALGPNVRAALGLSAGAYGQVLAQRTNAAVAIAMSMGWQQHRKGLRRFLALQAALSTAIGAVLAAWTQSFWPLFICVGLTAPTSGALWAIHRPMLIDGYVPHVRVRAVSAHQAFIVAGTAIAPAVVWFLVGPGQLEWRGALLVVGLLCGVAAVAGSMLLRNPVMGRHDTDRVRSAVRHRLGAVDREAGDHPGLGFIETLRRIWLVPTFSRLLAAWAVVGIASTPLLTYLSEMVQDRYGLGLWGRSTFMAIAWAFALPALGWSAKRADRRFARDPAALLRSGSFMLIVMAAGLVVAASSPAIGLALVGAGVALAASAVLVPSMIVTTLALVRPSARAAAGALVAAFLLGVGGQGGAMLLGGLDRRFGPAKAVALLAIPALGAAALVRQASRTVGGDLEQAVTEIVEAEEIAVATERGEHIPMLSCRQIDFSYGQLQVLFDVDFTIDEGEIVALLGTNGAGKSTLLRVISGLGYPSRGTVRFDGGDITYIDAERRVRAGIAQVPGGRAVFGPLTVLENLRVLGHSLGRNQRPVEAGIEASFDAFPRLAERRDQLASTLSGGEQQMLGLATAFIAKPRLLLIDELSLGLAPKVVGELLEMVRRINAAGTAVVLVEQSVNVALSVAEHAYFMEKGEIRFDGRVAELLGRPDLLRSVFLEGAAKGLDNRSGSR